MVVVTAAHVTVPAQTTPRIDDYLRSMGLNASEIADAANGKSIVKFLPSTNDRDVVVFGVIAVRVARDEYLAHALDSGRTGPGATIQLAPVRTAFTSSRIQPRRPTSRVSRSMRENIATCAAANGTTASSSCPPPR